MPARSGSHVIHLLWHPFLFLVRQIINIYCVVFGRTCYSLVGCTAVSGKRDRWVLVEHINKHARSFSQRCVGDDCSHQKVQQKHHMPQPFIEIQYKFSGSQIVPDRLAHLFDWHTHCQTHTSIHYIYEHRTEILSCFWQENKNSEHYREGEAK